MKSRRKREGRVLTILSVFIIIGVLSFLGFQFITKTGIFSVPGVVIYDDSLNSEELSILKDIFNDISLKRDVTISASSNTSLPATGDGTYLAEVSVPVTDFYEVRTDISEFSENEYEYIPISDLSFNKKLLTIEDNYYLDSFDKGAVFRTISFQSDAFDDEIKPLVNDVFTKKNFPTKDSVLTFAQSGVTALSRGMNSKINSVKDGKYFAEQIGDYLSSFDLTHTSNESSFTDLANGSNICSDWRFKDTLTAIGLDIVELTGNHNQDCGNSAAIESIDYYNGVGIKTVGGGKNASDAAKALELNEKGNKITFLAYNQSTGGATLGDTPGANQYYEENAVQEISAAKERGNFVIVDIQYYECSGYASEYEDTTCDYANSSAGDQVSFFRHLIDLGADLVVGTSAHQPQTFETYNNGVIYYGLGNLFFDQIWWPGTTRSLILAHYFHNGKLLQTKIVPTIYDSSLQTKLMDEENKRWFINRLIQVRP